MFDPTQENEPDRALRQGLQALSVPEPSADFTVRIHAALRVSPPWWKTLWQHARPVVFGTACSLVLVLAVLPLLTQMPSAPQAQRRLVSASSAALDRALDRPDLRAASLVQISRPSKEQTARVPQ